jgi:alpha,alpha-trehalase
VSTKPTYAEHRMLNCRRVAAYQVGLSFLTTHMRRAVAACTSPEVFFGRAANAEAAAVQATAAIADPLDLAMESLNIYA